MVRHQLLHQPPRFPIPLPSPPPPCFDHLPRFRRGESVPDGWSEHDPIIHECHEYLTHVPKDGGHGFARRRVVGMVGGRKDGVVCRDHERRVVHHPEDRYEPRRRRLGRVFTETWGSEVCVRDRAVVPSVCGRKVLLHEPGFLEDESRRRILVVWRGLRSALRYQKEEEDSALLYAGLDAAGNA